MSAPLILRIGLPLGFLLFVGCSHPTTVSGVKNPRELLAQLTPHEQALIKRGRIAIGFTTDMVYLALDKPDRIVTGPGPMQETWIYRSYYEADGSSIAPGQKINSHWVEETGGLGSSANKDGPSSHIRGAVPVPTNGASNLQLNAVTTTVDFDPRSTTIREEGHARTEVRFLRGVVADIRIIP